MHPELNSKLTAKLETYREPLFTARSGNIQKVKEIKQHCESFLWLTLQQDK